MKRPVTSGVLCDGRIYLILFVLLWSCSSDVQSKNNSNNANNLNNQNNANNSNNSNNTANNTTCSGGSPECAPVCGGDFFGGSICVDGNWECEEEGWIFVDDCPPGSCFGLPFPGEVCDDGFQCRPEETGALDSCPEQMCLTCSGFDPAVGSNADCNCRCTDDNVRCFTCEVTSTSDLGGVSIEWERDPCFLLLSDLEQSPHTFFYDIVIDQTADGIIVTPTPQDAGGCGIPNASRLITLERIEGVGDDAYCNMCDAGLCDPTIEPVELVAGTYRIPLEWSGRNWFGPSDTGLPMGEYFSEGEATMRVSAVGVDANQVPFEVRSELTIRLD